MGSSLPKPRLGEPCNGCGLCCLVEPCLLSVEYLGVHARCPVLETAGNRFACGLVTNPGVYLGTPRFGDPLLAERFGTVLGIGMGCDADDEVPA